MTNLRKGFESKTFEDILNSVYRYWDDLGGWPVDTEPGSIYFRIGDAFTTFFLHQSSEGQIRSTMVRRLKNGDITGRVLVRGEFVYECSPDDTASTREKYRPHFLNFNEKWANHVRLSLWRAGVELNFPSAHERAIWESENP